MCAKENTASFVSVAPQKASKLKTRRCVHKFGLTLLPLPLCCLFTAHPLPHSSSSDSLYTSFTLHEVPRAQLRYTNALTTLQKSPTPSSFSLSPSSLILFYIEKRKVSAVRASWISNFRTAIQKHINYHYYKRCARLTTALCAPPSPICSRSSSTSSADNVGYLAKLSGPFCPPFLPNLSPLFTSHFIELTCVTITMTSLAISASTQGTSNKDGRSVLPKLPIPLFLDMSSPLHTECITNVLVSSRGNYSL